MEGVYISLEFHHGGKFVNDPNLMDKEGQVSFAPRVDPDDLSLIELAQYTKDFGYAAVEGVYHRKCGPDNEDFRKVWLDSVVLEITKGLKNLTLKK